MMLSRRIYLHQASNVNRFWRHTSYVEVHVTAELSPYVRAKEHIEIALARRKLKDVMPIAYDGSYT